MLHVPSFSRLASMHMSSQVTTSQHASLQLSQSVPQEERPAAMTPKYALLRSCKRHAGMRQLPGRGVAGL